jgi:type IX secretion system PorP/SprF family membrane protein
MKKNLLFLLLVLLGVKVFAQQDPLYSQYMLNPLLINPAYSGLTTDLNASAMYRKQWAGFEGSPVTFNANAHIALSGNKMGAGLIVLQDQVGTDKTTEITATYAYHLPLNEKLKLSFGLQGGMINYQSDYSGITFNPADAKFTTSSEWKPNFGSGFFLQGERFMVGVSIPKMLKANSNIESFSTGLYTQHIYMLAAYVVPISYRIKFKPWILARAVHGAPVSLDYAASMKVDDSYSIGLFTRNFSTYGFLAQINLGDNLRFGYVFELPTKNSVGTQYATHELTLGVRLGVLTLHDLSTIRDF